MQNLESYLREKCADEKLISVILSLAESVRLVSGAVRLGANVGNVGTQNVYGEEQIKLDVLSNQIVGDVLKQNRNVGLIASEEMENEEAISAGEYAAAFDPLDGSSLVDTNLAVGSIFGIYKAKTFLGIKGDEQLAAMMAVYGPRTTIVLTVKKGVAEFLLNGEDFVLTKDNLRVGEGKMFAPGNLRACSERKDYLELMDFWCENEYTLRYSGGMVPDLNQILLKGKGIFSYPGYKDAPNGKLRVLYECAPTALIMEEAGGAARDYQKRILEIVLEKLDQRTPIFIGSKNEVERCCKALV